MNVSEGKKRRYYLFTVIIGIILEIFGIYFLVDAISEKDKTAIALRIFFVLLWAVFTFVNLRLYIRQKRKEQQ